ARALQALDAILENWNSVASQVSPVRCREPCCTIGTQDNVVAPCCHGSRHLEAAATLAIHCDGRVAHLPSIAVGTLKDARPEELLDAVEPGQVIENARRYQQFAAADTATL